MSNPYEDRARERKASAIVDLLVAKDVKASVAARLDRQGQIAAARLAGVHPPSRKTWDLVVERIRQKERIAQATVIQQNPFDGIAV